MMQAPWVMRSGEAPRVTVDGIGIDMRLLLPGGEAGAPLCAIEEHTAPGGGPPLHVHHRQSELFFFLEGSYRLAVGDQRPTVGPGDLALVPPGTPHTFRNIGDRPGRFLFVLTPALDSARFFTEFADLMRQGPVDPAALEAFAAPFGLEFVGPPLAAA